MRHDNFKELCLGNLFSNVVIILSVQQIVDF